MTEKLHQLLHEQASAPTFDVPDVDRIVGLGGTRIRRRRTALAAGGVVVAAVVGAVAVGLGDDPGTAVDPAIDGVVEPDSFEVSYALGSVIHDGDTSVDVGHRIAAYVRTQTGYVTADRGGRVWSVVDGAVEQIGVTDDDEVHLVSDPSSTLVGWVDTQDDTQFVVHDQADGSETRFRAAEVSADDAVSEGRDAAYFYALDDGVAYVRDGDDAVALDVVSGEATVIDPATTETSDVIDAEGGLVAFSVDQSDDVQRVAVGPTRAEAGQPFEALYGSFAAFSPGGAYLSFEEDELALYVVATGEPVDLGLTGFASAYEWLDADSVAVIAASDETGPVRLLSCDVATTTCEVAVPDLGNFDQLDGLLVLPLGTDFSG